MDASVNLRDSNKASYHLKKVKMEASTRGKRKLQIKENNQHYMKQQAISLAQDSSSSEQITEITKLHKEASLLQSRMEHLVEMAQQAAAKAQRRCSSPKVKPLHCAMKDSSFSSESSTNLAPPLSARLPSRPQDSERTLARMLVKIDADSSLRRRHSFDFSPVRPHSSNNTNANPIKRASQQLLSPLLLSKRFYEEEAITRRQLHSDMLERQVAELEGVKPGSLSSPYPRGNENDQKDCMRPYQQLHGREDAQDQDKKPKGELQQTGEEKEKENKLPFQHHDGKNQQCNREISEESVKENVREQSPKITETEATASSQKKRKRKKSLLMLIRRQKKQKVNDEEHLQTSQKKGRDLAKRGKDVKKKKADKVKPQLNSVKKVKGKRDEVQPSVDQAKRVDEEEVKRKIEYVKRKIEERYGVNRSTSLSASTEVDTDKSGESLLGSSSQSASSEPSQRMRKEGGHTEKSVQLNRKDKTQTCTASETATDESSTKYQEGQEAKDIPKRRKIEIPEIVMKTKSDTSDVHNKENSENGERRHKVQQSVKGGSQAIRVAVLEKRKSLSSLKGHYSPVSSPSYQPVVSPRSRRSSLAPRKPIL